MSAPSGFWQVNTRLATRNPKFQTKIEPNVVKTFLFWFSTDFGGKIQKFLAEIEPVYGKEFFLVCT